MAEVKSGWMFKCGKSVKSWKKRWFVLKPNGYLYYYEGPGKTEKGKVDVIDAAKVAPWQEVGTAEKKIPSNLSGSNAFAIVTGDRTYTCCCEQEGESLAWIAAIEKVQGAAGSGEQHYPPPTYTEEAQVKRQDPLMSAPPPYMPSSPQHETPPSSNGPPPPQMVSQPPQQPTAPPPQQQTPPSAPMGMPNPGQYGGTMPIGLNSQPPASGFRSNPSGGPGYQGAYPTGNYQQGPPPPRPQQPPPRPQYYQQPPPPRPQQPPPRPQYYQQQPPPRPPYQQPPPPRPGYCPPPRPAYQSYPQRPPPPQQYYQRPPPPRQQTTTNVTVITLPAQQRVVYR